MGFLSNRQPEPEWPPVPLSLDHSSIELQDGHMAEKYGAPPPPPPDTAGSVTPYLGLRARLSQVWLNRWTVLLLLVLVRVLLSVGGLNDDIDDAKAQALQACTKVEDIGSAMASMPHYLSVGVNEIAGDSITKAVHAMVDILMMVLTGVEELILFVINMYIGTYVCLTAALIHGGLDLGVGAANAVTNTINSAITDITDGLESDISGVQDTINSAFSAVSSAASVFGKQLTPPTINITARVDDLRNIHVDDTDFVKTLVTLNNTIPTYAQAENDTRNAISIPFDMVKNLLNSSYGGYSFDTSVFPVAQKQALTFCSDNSLINDFFESLYGIAATARIAFIVSLCVLAVLACVPATWMEIRRFRRQQRHAAVLTRHGFDPMDVVYIASRPVTATAGIRLASRLSGKRQLLARWAVAYATSLPALFVLSLALAGFFSCFCQFLLLRAVQKEAPALATQVGDFAGEVVGTLGNVSTRWADDANGVILGFQGEINNDILGYVVNATTAVNNTLNVFSDEINKGIQDVFGGTVLENTVQQVVNCLVGLKIDAVEKGLTWVHDHAHVTMPLFPNDTFSAGAKQSIDGDSDLTSFLASPSSVTTDEITGAVDKVVDHLRNAIVQEALISTGLLLVYVIVVLIGVLWSAVALLAPDRTRAEGGQRYYRNEHDDNDNGSTSTSTGRGVGGMAEPGPRFPQFEGVAESGAVDDFAAAAVRDEKLGAATTRQQQQQQRQQPREWQQKAAPVRKALAKSQGGHWRGSSHGQVEDAGSR